MDTSTLPADAIRPSTREEWRAWLDQHHARSNGVRVVLFKKSAGKAQLDYDGAVEEALCYGWIDSRVNSLDAERTIIRFTPRRPRSVWSRLNKSRIERLMATGLMRPAGLRRIEEAKRDGSWTSLDAIEALEIPADLADAFNSVPAARANFHQFPPSSRQIILWWIASARRPRTRQQRIEETVRLAAENIRAAHPRR
jgi:uncharacterized protein YdeI (YjbR/CyaY-like superfamily)